MKSNVKIKTVLAHFAQIPAKITPGPFFVRPVMMTWSIGLFLFTGLFLPFCAAEELCAPRVTVEAEEDVYPSPNADNGSGPMWCFGSTCMVRSGGDIYISDMIRLEDAKPLNNCRCRLLVRGEDGWSVRWSDESRTREPSPLAIAPFEKRLFFSANPTLVSDKTAYNGPSRPEILEFLLTDSSQTGEPKTLLPQWDAEPPFSEHSYRSLSADGACGELVLLQNIGYDHAEWSFLNREGEWSACGQLFWPTGKEYEGTPPLRLCYPSAALSDRALYFLGGGDIIEPIKAWRTYKKELTGQTWDYVFRRLFYTRCPDITKGEFEPWQEIANRDATAGHLFPCDLWVDPDKTVFLLWYEEAVDLRLRDHFFPNEKQTIGLYYAMIRDGQAVQRGVIDEYREGENRLRPGRGRFHVTPSGTLYVIYYASGLIKEESVPASSDPLAAPERQTAENRILQLGRDGKTGPYSVIPFKKPFMVFFTASVRAGNLPSQTLDLLGSSSGSPDIRYGRVQLEE